MTIHRESVQPEVQHANSTWKSLLQQMYVGINHGQHVVCGISFCPGLS